LIKSVAGYVLLAGWISFGDQAHGQVDVPPLEQIQAFEKGVRSLIDAVGPAVVTVRSIPSDDSDKGRGAARQPRAMSVGSGIILDTLGRILTTARVVEGSDDFWIELADGRLFRGVMLGSNRDVAVLEIDVDGLLPAPIGDATELGVGSFVAAIGNSYGYSGALTWGVVNGFRPDGTIQLSLSVSAGNSGGALVDSRGQVVGLIKAKVSEPYYIDPLHLPSDGERPAIALPGRRLELPTSSVSLALPIGNALRAAARLTESGEEVPAYVGVYVEDLTGWHAVHFKTQYGVLVTGVVDQTPADRFGLTRGDVVTRVDREPVQTVQRFRQIVAQAQPGQRLLFDIIRGGKPLKLVVEAGRSDIPHLSNTVAPAPARSVSPASVTRPAVSQTAGAGAMRLHGQSLPDTGVSIDDSRSDYEERLRRLEDAIDSLKRDLSGARHPDSP
jgi:S1-C subfamily serine protease